MEDILPWQPDYSPDMATQDRAPHGPLVADRRLFGHVGWRPARQADLMPRECQPTAHVEMDQNEALVSVGFSRFGTAVATH